MKDFDHGKKWMPIMYVTYFGLLQKIAHKHGYALCVHGSVIRDFDLIAVPFEDKVSSHLEVLQEIRNAIGNVSTPHPIFDRVGHEPQFRTCYTIESGAGGYFDISFTPTYQEAMDRARSEISKELEVQEMLSKIRTHEQA